ncbi:MULTISPECIES: cell division protein FtsB [unclassified Agarivorans]|uniref:cell division protein FtsB n=1 Tax=unclassified Agarivorans TaxID=2636026 RepID=UPI0010D95DD5|nr:MULTISPECIES: cell division protein FtsB [unclassified Agarivorans]MDO6684291.1 cell division protein FtsB [Agarivorans sp. 3_MG-2023]MDO6714457.1 cell division protein FtsB [Agarivorans sp. 2_MG-2023]MDO6763154.1 cell division protein FtsB [Agarivorans sp. 1_MG-2023]GDY24421.1 cell division protein FtsB [Agarivorans sp. Toyoura001]
MRSFKILLILIVLLLQYQLWFGKNSLNDYFALRDEVAKHAVANQDLGQRNAVLVAEIADLRSGLDAVEEQARNELGMIKEGETFYRIIPSSELE